MVWRSQLELPDVGEVEGAHRMLPYLQTYKKKGNDQKSERLENPICNIKCSPRSIGVLMDCIILLEARDQPSSAYQQYGVNPKYARSPGARRS